MSVWMKGNQSKIILQSKNCWVFWSGFGFISVVPPPLLLACYWPLGLLAWLMTLWHYFSPERHRGPGLPGPGMWPFSGYVLSEKDASGWKFDESTRTCWACKAQHGGGRAASWNWRWKNKTTTCFPWILFLAQILLCPTGMWSHYIESPKSSCWFSSMAVKAWRMTSASLYSHWIPRC